MSQKTFDDPWALISVDASHHLGRRIADRHALSVYWVKGADGAPGLFLRGIDRNAVPSKLPKSRGISVQVSIAEDKDPEARLFLLSPADREVFLALCNDVVAYSSRGRDAREATAALFRRLDHWQGLLSKGPPQEMGPPEIRGLIGELCVLLRLAKSAGIGAALAFWVAPDEHPQDFALGERLLEIKARLAGSRQQVKISSLEQLEAANLPIYLVAIQLAPSKADASFSLNDIVGKVLDLANEDGAAALDRAESLLLRRGYLAQEAYGVDRYVVSGERAFLVEDGFPRLVRSKTDLRVQQATYILDMTALGTFERPLETVFPS